MKTTIVILSAAVLIAAAPVVLAQGLPSRTSGLQHKAANKHHRGVSGYAPLRNMQGGRSRAIRELSVTRLKF